MLTFLQFAFMKKFTRWDTMHLLYGEQTTKVMTTSSHVISGGYQSAGIDDLKRELEIKTYEVTELSRKLTKSHEEAKRLADQNKELSIQPEGTGTVTSGQDLLELHNTIAGLKEQLTEKNILLHSGTVSGREHPEERLQQALDELEATKEQLDALQTGDVMMEPPFKSSPKKATNISGGLESKIARLEQQLADRDAQILRIGKLLDKGSSSSSSETTKFFEETLAENCRLRDELAMYADSLADAEQQNLSVSINYQTRAETA